MKPTMLRSSDGLRLLALFTFTSLTLMTVGAFFRPDLDQDKYEKIDAQKELIEESLPAYKQAIERNKDSFRDKVVVHFGTRTGILPILAVQAGAKLVLAMGRSKGFLEAEKLIGSQKPEIKNRIMLLKRWSVDSLVWSLGREKEFSESLKEHGVEIKDNGKWVDTFMFEWVGYEFFLEDKNFLSSMLEARDRFLKPGGRIFPEKVALHLSGIQDWFRVKHAEYASEDVDEKGVTKELDLSPFSHISILEELYKALQDGYYGYMHVESGQVVTNMLPIWEFDLSTARRDDKSLDFINNSYPFELSVTAQGGHIFAFALHFELTFPQGRQSQMQGAAGAAVLSNSPAKWSSSDDNNNSPNSVKKSHWKQIVIFKDTEMNGYPFVHKVVDHLGKEQEEEEYSAEVTEGDQVKGLFGLKYKRSFGDWKPLFSISRVELIRKQQRQKHSQQGGYNLRNLPPSAVQRIDPISELDEEGYCDAGNHRMMIEDRPRTLAYKRAIEKNKERFKGAIVLDVGTGTSLLSIFAARADAALVIAVDRTGFIRHAAEVVALNGLSDRIFLVGGDVRFLTKKKLLELMTEAGHSGKKIWEEKGMEVDIIISEWMGFGLFDENMLLAVLRARDTFLKRDGLMFPDSATLHICVIRDWFRLDHSEYCLEEEEQGNGKQKEDVKRHEAPRDLSLHAPKHVPEVEEDETKEGYMSLRKEQVMSTSALIWKGEFGHGGVQRSEWAVKEKSKIFEKPFKLRITESSFAFGFGVFFKVTFPAPPPPSNESSKSSSARVISLSTAPDAPPTHWLQKMIVRDTRVKNPHQGYFFSESPNHEKEMKVGECVSGTYTMYENVCNPDRHVHDVTFGGECSGMVEDDGK